MNVTIRPATPNDARAIAAVHVASWRTTYRGIVDEAVLSQLSVRQRAQYWRETLERTPPQLMYVAVDEADEIIGFATGGEEREGDEEFSAELYAIYLLQETQGQGIGRRLADAIINDLRIIGHKTILVWVLADNPATHFYAATGAVPVRERSIEIAGVQHQEVGYGWRF